MANKLARLHEIDAKRISRYFLQPSWCTNDVKRLKIDLHDFIKTKMAFYYINGILYYNMFIYLVWKC